ncbi:MAG TPA: transcriptional repressor [Bacteroidales bacterium]|nr:transcriptional repressor [Bacteroidales bacterium]
MKPKEILHNRKLIRTGCREEIISVITSAEQALSEEEIKSKLTGSYDRTTFYRTFKTLREKEIIHKIVLDNQLVKYALNHETYSKLRHIHFYCKQCDKVVCLTEAKIDIPNLPIGFLATENEIIVKGLCGKCNK